MSTLRLEDGVEAGDEHVGRYVADDHVVYPLEHLARRVKALGRRAEHSTSRRHHQGGGHTLVRHVTDDKAELAVVELQEVVEVAAYLASGLVVSRKLVAGQIRHMFGEKGLLHQARDPELLLDALALLGLLLLLADELGYLHSRCCLGSQVVEELPVVGRVLLLGEARPQVEKPDQLALAHQRHDHLDVGFLHGPEGRRIQIELVDLDHPGSAGEVSHNGVVGRYLHRGPWLLAGSLHNGLGDLLAGLLSPVTSEEALPETLPVSLLCRHRTSSPLILVAKRLPDVTKSVTKSLLSEICKVIVSRLPFCVASLWSQLARAALSCSPMLTFS